MPLYKNLYIWNHESLVILLKLAYNWRDTFLTIVLLNFQESSLSDIWAVKLSNFNHVTCPEYWNAPTIISAHYVIFCISLSTRLTSLHSFLHSVTFREIPFLPGASPCFPSYNSLMSTSGFPLKSRTWESCVLMDSKRIARGREEEKQEEEKQEEEKQEKKWERQYSKRSTVT